MNIDFKKYNGLTDKEVQKLKKDFGDNTLSKKEKESLLQKILEGFKDKMIIILLVALAINTVLVFFGQAEWYEAVGIAVAVIIANVVGALSEYKNENEFERLQEEASNIKCKVIRNGKLIEISINDIVFTDLVVLQAGDKVPADGFIVAGKVKVNQAALNGESEEAEKSENGEYIQNLNDGKSLYRESIVVDGECIMNVVDIGDKTMYGKVSKEMQEDTRESPLKVKLGKLADQISKFGYIGAIVIAIAYLFQVLFIHTGFNMTETLAIVKNIPLMIKHIVDAVVLAVVIIVMAVPEGLPMMIALVSSMNMRKMLKDNVLVRKINGIETAGGLNILFTDKTGTITEGKLSVEEIVNANLNKTSLDESRDLVIGIGYNNSSKISGNEVIGGNSTDRCLMQHILNSSFELKDIQIDKFEAFDSTKKYSLIEVSGDVYRKGSPEAILPLCKNIDIEKINEYINEQCKKAMRLIAVSKNDELIAIISIRDKIRKESEEAIKQVKRAGVQVVMITGDRKETAVAIAYEVGLVASTCGDNLFGKQVYTHDELEAMTDEEIKAIIPNLRVIARALPTDKSRLVRIAQELDLVVAMTGDGINDSSALKKADVGFAMGSGTEVAKEAGDIVILDDNFSSIEKAILYGRTIFKSIRKFIVFQLTVNVAAVMLCFLAPLLGVSEPLTIIQILWINLIMDTLGAIAFGGEPALKRYMEEKPIARSENILSKNMISQILTAGIYISGVSLLLILSKSIQSILPQAGEIYVETIMFAFFIFAVIFNGFNARSDSKNLLEHIKDNKKFLIVMGTIAIIQVIMVTIGGTLLRTTPLNFKSWLIVIVISLLIIPIDILRKHIINRG